MPNFKYTSTTNGATTNYNPSSLYSWYSAIELENQVKKQQAELLTKHKVIYAIAEKMFKDSHPQVLTLVQALLKYPFDVIRMSDFYDRERQLEKIEGLLKNIRLAWNEKEVTTLVKLWITDDWRRAIYRTDKGEIDLTNFDFKTLGNWFWTLAGSKPYPESQIMWKVETTIESPFSLGNKSIGLYIDISMEAINERINGHFNSGRSKIRKSEQITVTDPDSVFEEIISLRADRKYAYIGARYFTNGLDRPFFYGERDNR